jgi:hypothetical protein
MNELFIMSDVRFNGQSKYRTRVVCRVIPFLPLFLSLSLSLSLWYTRANSQAERIRIAPLQRLTNITSHM